jgi:CheY-like chemotaxis protein
MDINMPVMDGIEATKSIRIGIKKGDYNETKVIGVSAYCE